MQAPQPISQVSEVVQKSIDVLVARAEAIGLGPNEKIICPKVSGPIVMPVQVQGPQVMAGPNDRVGGMSLTMRPGTFLAGCIGAQCPLWRWPENDKDDFCEFVAAQKAQARK